MPAQVNRIPLSRVASPKRYRTRLEATRLRRLPRRVIRPRPLSQPQRLTQLGRLGCASASLVQSVVRLIARGHSGPHFVCTRRMSASACQLIPYAFVRFPSSERSSAKSPCRRVNDSCSPLQPLIIVGKIPNGTPSPPPVLHLFRPRASVNSRSQNIFNGFLRVPVNEKIPALNFI